MAFQFPEDKQEFVAPNGITYAYESGKWMIKSYGEKLDLSPYVEQDVFDEDQTRQDAVIANETAINETQSDQINLIETQIQLLAKAQAVGKWKYVRNISGASIRPPAVTTFYGTHTDGADTVLRNWSDLRLLMVHKTDLEGTEYAFTNFEEGDKIEILDTDGSSACYGTLTNNPTQEAYGNMIVAVERANGGPRDDKEYILSVYRPGAVSGDVDLDVLDERYLRLTGGTLESSLKIQRGEDKTHPQYKIAPNGGTDYATNIYTYEGQMRFRTSHTGADSDAQGSHIVLDPDVAGDGANPVTKIWKVATPTSADMAANRAYVDEGVDSAKTYTDEQIAAIPAPTGSVPVGSIMIWMNSGAPDGWFKLQGGSFDVDAYPLLHAYLERTYDYTSGTLPNWSGRYPGEWGNHLNYDLGRKVDYETARPKNAFTTDNPGDHKHRYGNTDYGGGATHSADDARNHSKYQTDGAGAHTHTITGGGDSTTRPRTIVVHYIIKHD